MKEVTVRELEAAIRADLEPTEPQNTILAWLREKWEGKPISKRIETDLRQLTGDDSIRLVRPSFGSPELTWGNYHGSRGNEGGCIFLRVNGDGIDTAAIEEGNARHFGALRERNEQRERVLADRICLEALAYLINRYNQLRAHQDYIQREIAERAQGPLSYVVRDLAKEAYGAGDAS